MEMTGNMIPRENGIQPPARIAPQPPQPQQQQGPEQMLQMLLMLLMSAMQQQGGAAMQGQPQGMPQAMPPQMAAPPSGMEALLMGK